MILYEYEGKKFFEKYGILVPRGVLVLKGEDVAKAYRSLDRWEVVCKAQARERGRTKKGLIRFCLSEDDALTAAEDIWKQGVHAILIEEKLDIAEERYFSIANDEKLGQPVLQFGLKSPLLKLRSTEGGEMERHVLDLRADSDIPGAGFPHIPFAQAAWNLFRREKALSLEIDPLVKTKDNIWVALDVRIMLQ